MLNGYLSEAYAQWGESMVLAYVFDGTKNIWDSTVEGSVTSRGSVQSRLTVLTT